MVFAVVDPAAGISYVDAGAVTILSGVIVTLWQRCKNLEERSRSDLKESLNALHTSTAALKDVVKTVERLEQRLREGT